MPVNREAIRAQLVLHEGLELHIYDDGEGNDTLGVGYNVTARGLDAFNRAIGRTLDLMSRADQITRAEALVMLDIDIDRVEGAVAMYFPDYVNLDEVRQRVCVDMGFNLGFRALGFHKCIAAIERKDWSRAARELYNSKWAREVKGRCDRLANMLLTGIAPTDVPPLVS